MATQDQRKFLERAEKTLAQARLQYESSIRDMAKKLSEYAAQETIPEYRVGDIEGDFRWVKKSADEIKRIESQIVAIKDFMAFGEE